MIEHRSARSCRDSARRSRRAGEPPAKAGTNPPCTMRKQKELLIGDGLNGFLRRIGKRFVSDATDLLAIPEAAGQNRKPYQVIPRAKKGIVNSYMYEALKKINEVLYERVGDYAEAWMYYFRATCAIMDIEWNPAVSAALGEGIGHMVDLASRGGAVRAERELTEIAAVGTLVEILESPAYVSQPIRETAIKTVSGGRVGLGWRKDAVTTFGAVEKS
jgi:hypothetical protein